VQLALFMKCCSGIDSSSANAVGLSPRTDTQLDISVSQPQRYKPTVLQAERLAGRPTVYRVQYCHVISPICDWCMIVFRNQFSMIKELVSFVCFLFRSGVCCIQYKCIAGRTVRDLPVFHSAKVGIPYRVTKTLSGAEELRHRAQGIA
jgi:hypothetical protein